MVFTQPQLGFESTKRRADSELVLPPLEAALLPDNVRPTPNLLLGLGGEFNRPPHVATSQLKTGVEVLLRRDGCGVGVAQRLRDKCL